MPLDVARYAPSAEKQSASDCGVKGSRPSSPYPASPPPPLPLLPRRASELARDDAELCRVMEEKSLLPPYDVPVPPYDAPSASCGRDDIEKVDPAAKGGSRGWS